jgi:hypothetical protein
VRIISYPLSTYLQPILAHQLRISICGICSCYHQLPRLLQQLRRCQSVFIAHQRIWQFQLLLVVNLFNVFAAVAAACSSVTNVFAAISLVSAFNVQAVRQLISYSNFSMACQAAVAFVLSAPVLEFLQLNPQRFAF